MKLLIASNNPDKTSEMQHLLSDLPVEVISLAAFPDAPEVIEDGKTFAENAAKKAREIAQYSGLHAVADDSGLCVDALDGEPGVYSARFAGPNGTYDEVCKKLLRLMRKTPDGQRQAHFQCHIAMASPHGQIEIETEGRCEGIITRQMRGGRGFGYDPVFLYPPAGKTFAQMKAAEKHKFSHRGKAMESFKAKLKDFLQSQESI